MSFRIHGRIHGHIPHNWSQTQQEGQYFRYITTTLFATKGMYKGFIITHFYDPGIYTD